MSTGATRDNSLGLTMRQARLRGSQDLLLRDCSFPTPALMCRSLPPDSLSFPQWCLPGRRAGPNSLSSLSFPLGNETSGISRTRPGGRVADSLANSTRRTSMDGLKDLHLEPIADGDETIASAIEAAHLPSLIAALVHVTGDASLVGGDIKPVYDFF